MPGGLHGLPREGQLTRLLLAKALERLSNAARVDVAIAGAGPAGLTAAWLLAEKGLSVTVVEHRLGTGGGMRGGAMLLPAALVEEELGADILRRAGVRLEPAAPGLYYFDPTEAAAKLTARAIDAGATIIPGLYVEDLIVREDGRVEGLVVNWAPVEEAGWHVDPLYIEAKAVIDATGHDAQLLRILEKRFPGKIKVPGMSSLDAWRAERLVVEKSEEVLPGLYVAGMATAEAFNLPRMGPVFGGMFESARRVAEEIAGRLLARGEPVEAPSRAQ